MKTSIVIPAETRPAKTRQITIERGEEVIFSPELKALLDESSENSKTSTSASGLSTSAANQNKPYNLD